MRLYGAIALLGLLWGKVCFAQTVSFGDAKISAVSWACKNFDQKNTQGLFLDFKEQMSITCVEGDWQHHFTLMSYLASPNRVRYQVDTPVILQPIKFYGPHESPYGEFIMYYRHLTKDLDWQMLKIKAEMKVKSPETGYARPKGLYVHGRYFFKDTEIVLGARDPITEIEDLVYGHVCKILRDQPDVMICKPPQTAGGTKFWHIFIRQDD